MSYLKKQNQLARKSISEALTEYEADDYSSAKEVLVALLKSREETVASAHSYEANQTPAPNPIAWVSWVELAIDRLNKHLGQDVIAVTPVPLCLNTALELIPEANPRSAGRPPIGDKPKVKTMVSIDPDLKAKAKSAGINLSQFLDEALRERLPS